MWVKICGIRDAATAAQVAALKPDTIGLNFYPNTPRYVDRLTATEITATLPAAVEPVGLFVDESAESIHEICHASGLKTIQLHGDESADLLCQLSQQEAAYRLIRAWKLGPEGLGPLEEYLCRLKSFNVRPFACLIDARVPGKHGGTGKRVDWDLLNRDYNRDDWPPLILAGGLTPENVTNAIQAVQPWGVDVASGVESSPGVKDIALVKRFIQQARTAT